MAGNVGPSGLEARLERIRLNYIKLVEKAKTENMKSLRDLEKQVVEEEEDLRNRQERERRDFEIKMLKEKYALKERHLQEKTNADKKAAKRLKQAEDFIENIKPSSGHEKSPEEIR